MKYANIRFIILYRVGQNKKSHNEESTKVSPSRQTYNQNILRGTTRFEHSSKEYVRVFETSQDGFINFSVNPSICATAKVLTNKNQRVSTGVATWYFNVEIPKGKYKLLIKTNKTCDISLQYL